MDIERIQHEALAALKAFNTAVTTSRLYPAASPQVGNAVEKAYQAIKTFSRTVGQLSFGKSPEGLLVCGLPADEQVAEELGNMIIYRHLALLKLEHVVLRPTFDRTVFSAILTVFTARKEKIAREGGGRPFVNGLGLASYFPEEAPEPERDPAQTEATTEVSIETAAVPQDVLNDLFARRDPSTRLAAMPSYLQDTSRAVDLVVAGIARMLQELSAAGTAPLPTRSAAFSRFVRRIGSHLAPTQHQQIAAGAAGVILRTGSALFLTRLYCQDYPDAFGRQLFSALVELAPNELFDAALARLRELNEQSGGPGGKDSVDAAVVAATVELLAETPKGKLYLGKEKARSLLESSEQERRDKRIEAGIGALLNGNLAGLRSEELLLNLPEEIENYYRRGNETTADRLVEIMAGEMLGGDDHLRRRLVRSLVMVGSVLFAQERWASLEKMGGALISWVRESEEGDSASMLPAKLGDWVTTKADERLARPQPNSLTHPAIKPIVADAASDLFELGIARYRQLELDDAASGVVVGGRFDSGDVFLVERKLGQGSVLQTAISLDNVSGNLITLEAFPELMHRVVYHLCRASDVELNFSGGGAISIALPNIAPAGRMATATEPGLIGEYFNGANFDDRKFVRRDANLDFGWGWQPGGGVDPNNFLVRWTGYVMPRFDETYTFLLESSGDAKLWIDGKQVLAESGEARVRMRALRRHPIRVEFADRGGVRFLRLQWSSASQRREAVPASLLSHATEAAATDSATNVLAVETPDGQSLEATAKQRGAALVISVEGAMSPGAYRVHPPQSLRTEIAPYANPDGELLFSVSADPRESDMTPLSEEDYDQLVEIAGMQRVSGFDDLMAIAANRPRGRELWKYLAVCALLLLVCEVAITRWIAAQRGSNVELTVSFRPGGRASPVEMEEFAR